MDARIKWIENVMFVAESGTGHALVVDGSPGQPGLHLNVVDGRLMKTVARESSQRGIQNLVAPLHHMFFANLR